ncbi:hypothetical protein COV61_01290 [Candidatus Micrarchaeota archaeon CG11_big_fil_rev_8_21_14_0_20_47_5]|nr:MAG: hypothetical protein AUJ17_03130 [Candidatus Micrarchaeota archaeon CG1_02_47_40]PIN84057.1 MAG: hypothetical protein COV61_01290 [Candidatus Micrarchaeota archaeon CG11_big_fil_rev_8_21_14_0_20_47_5]
MKRNVLLLSLLLALACLSFAQNMSSINSALEAFCGFLLGVMPVLTMLMVVGAGAVYAGGQIMGAETRARANVWATAMLVGALIGIVIAVLGPFVMSTMYGSGWDVACAEGGGAPAFNCGTVSCTGATSVCCQIGGSDWCCQNGYACGSQVGGCQSPQNPD